MTFLLKVGIVAALIIAVLPANRQQQEELYQRAANAVHWTTTFCDRNGPTCTQAGGLWNTFMSKAKFGARIAYDMAALLATVHGLSQVGGVLTIPAISDYVGRRYTLITSNTVAACTFVGIIAVGANISWLFVIIGIVGVCYGITFPMYGACAGDYFPKEVIGTVLGAWTTCYGLGAIGGLIVAGRIRDVMQSFGWAFFVAVACAGIAAVLIFLVRDQTTHDLAVKR